MIDKKDWEYEAEARCDFVLFLSSSPCLYNTEVGNLKYGMDSQDREELQDYFLKQIFPWQSSDMAMEPHRGGGQTLKNMLWHLRN